MIQVENVTKSYGAIQAVHGLSFEVREGEIFGLLGPNGAGKSTTIAVVVGLISPDSGSVSVRGRSPRIPSTRMEMGVAPQGLSLYADLTAAENLQFFGRMYGLSGATLSDRVRWALDLAGLRDRASHFVKTFSGGMKRRLNIAVALIHDPKILLLDEPTVGVDPQSRNHIFEVIERLNRDGLTILYTTHYMEEAQRLCDRVAIVDQGQLLALDTIDGLLDAHGGQNLITGVLDHVPDSVELPGTVHEGRWRLDSANALADLSKVAAMGATFRTVQITRPDLESVFLKLTGKTLRD